MSEYSIYKRPYFNEIFKRPENRDKKPFYPYNQSLFLEFDIFPLFILDGGAFFFTMDHIGGCRGSDFIKALLSGKLLEPWIQGNRINWDKAIQGEKIVNVLPREKHFWINRLYFLLPIAHQFIQTKDEEWAKLWLYYFNRWYEKHDKYLSETKSIRFFNIAKLQIIRFIKSKLSINVLSAIKKHHRIGRRSGWLVWSDMQLSWRFMVIIHCINLLSNSKFLLEEHWQKIYYFIIYHAECIYREVMAELKTFGRGNHFLQKGVALLYAGLLFPEIDSAREYVERGREVVYRHMLNEISDDGLSAESSPSYSHFIARLHLEAFILLKANGEMPIAGLKDSVIKQYQFLNQTATPSGLSLTFSDSYHLDVKVDTLIARELIPTLKYDAPQSVFFRKSNFAVLRHGKINIFIDGTSENLYHHHHGKPHLILYFDRFPVLIDSGCYNYDRKEYKEWYVTPQAHNIVLVEPMHIRKRKTENTQGTKVLLFDFKNKSDEKSITMIRESNSRSFNYSWQRRVFVNNFYVKIIDQISSKKCVKCTLFFHLAFSSIIEKQEKGIFNVSNPNWNIVIKQETEDTNTDYVRQKIALNESNKQSYSPELRMTAEGDKVNFRTILTFQQN